MSIVRFSRQTAMLAVGLFMVSALSSCASIIEGSSQDVTIQPHPQTQTSCRLANDLGSWSAYAATPVTIKRSKSDLTIQCDGGSMTGRTINQSGVEEWAFLNILIGGIIGLGVDAATGALFAYDDMITVPMQPHGAAATPAVNTQPATVPQAPAPAYNAPRPNAPYYAPANPAGQPAAAPYGILRPPVTRY